MSFTAVEEKKAVNILYPIFKIAASLRLALFILFSLMASLAAGTFIESAHGTAAARIVIYDSFWFHALLFFLGINVAAAALYRLPWKKKHAGFVITHLGILIILGGSFLTQKLMMDGQMSLAEGETNNFITVPEPLLYIFSENLKRDWLIAVQEKPFAWQGEENLPEHKPAGLPLEISVIANYPKARLKESWEPAAGSGPSALETDRFKDREVLSSDRTEGNPALHVTLHNSFMNESFWLVENDRQLGEIPVGPAKLKFTDRFLTENPSAAAGRSGYLEFQFEKANVQIPLEENMKLPATFQLENTPYQATLTRLFKNAGINGRELVERKSENPSRDAGKESGDRSGQGFNPALETVGFKDREVLSSDRTEGNPAAELMLEGNGLLERHTVFSRYPDFPTLHGLKPSAAGAKIFYRFPYGGSRGETHELRFVTKDGGLFYQVQSGIKINSGKVDLSREVTTGWMDLNFRVDQFFPHAKRNRVYSAESNKAEGEEIFPALRLQLKKGDEEKTLWLGQGLRETVEIGGRHYIFLYGQRRIPAGFRLKLKDFRVENYPGTNRPASFESDVRLLDDMRGVSREATISMNQPLVYRGLRIYQSGYQQNPSGPEVSIFSVGRDPGVPVKYAGTIIMITGIILMFYTRSFSSNAGRIV